MTINETFEDLVAELQPAVDDSGFQIIPGRRRSLKFGVYAEGYMDTFVFAASTAQAKERARQEYDVPDDVEILAKWVREGVYLKYRIN